MFWKWFDNAHHEQKKAIYLDHAGATPLDEDVLRAMRTAEQNFANPSAIHRGGVKARRVIEKARGDISRHLSCQSDEIVFTGSATESNNLALFGVARPALRAHAKGEGSKPHIIVSAIEHPSILETTYTLELEGADVSYLSVDKDGIVDLKELKNLLRPETVLISVMYANNEIGTIQPIREIAKIIRTFKKTSSSQKLKTKNYQLSTYPLLHVDACQAVNYLDMNTARLGVDLMTWNASKIYGPKGIGALFVRRGVKLKTMLFGGGQERGNRAGTENLTGIVGFAHAMRAAQKMSESESSRLTKLRDFFIQKVLEDLPAGEAGIPGTVLNGSQKNRLPNNANFSFPNMEADELVLRLDAKGIAVSAKSACASSEEGGSYVVRALGRTDEQSNSSARFSFGRCTTKRELEKVIHALRHILLGENA